MHDSTQSDVIPLLPPMPRRRRRRLPQPLIIAGIIAVAAASLAIIGVLVRARNEQHANEVFAQAEEFFRGGTFAKAEDTYRLFRQQFASDPRASQAAAAEELCRIAVSLSDDLADPARVVRALDDFWSDHAADPTMAERWPIVMTVAERTTRSVLDRAQRTLAPGDAQAGSIWLDWLRRQQQERVPGAESFALADLDRMARDAGERIATESRRRQLSDAAERAIRDTSPANVAAAFQAFRRARAEHATPDETNALFDRLREAVRSTVRLRPPPAQPAAAPELPRLPVEPYTRLSTRQQWKTVTLGTDQPAFVRVKDLCFALDAATGSPRWVIRVGYDAPLPRLVPVSSRSAVLVSWFRGSDQVLSLCDAATGEVIWSWPSPQPLSGMPAVARGGVFAVASGGTVWQLDLETGTPLGVLELPEPIAAPPAVHEDERGLCLVGAEHGIYLLDLNRDVPECSDLVWIERLPQTAHCQALWVSRYLVIFENDLVDRCHVRVLYRDRDSGRHRQVRELDLAGRVWTPPVLDGYRLFLVTDRWRQYCFGLHPDDSSVNLFDAATAPAPPELADSVLPSFGHVPELPFAAQLDELVGYRIDADRKLLVVAWHRRAPEPGATPAQPLQVADRTIVAAWQEAGRDGVLVQAIDADRGEPVWQTRLGSAARDVAVAGAPAAEAIVARTDSRTMFALTRNPAGKWRTRMLELPQADSPVRFSGSPAELIFASGGGSRLERVATAHWRPGEPVAVSPPVGSAFVTYDGPFTIRGENTRREVTGRWAFFVSVERTIELRSLDGRERDVFGVRLPSTQADSEPARWMPVVLSADSIIVAHPAGVLCRAEVRETEGIKHLYVTECRTDLSPLAAAPAAVASVPQPTAECIVWPGSDRQCLLLSAATLKTAAVWEAPQSIGGRVVSGHAQVFLPVEGGIQAIKLDDGRLVPLWQRQLDGTGWQPAAMREDRLLAFDAAGRLLALDRSSGQTVWSHAAPAPLSLPPQWAGDEIVLVTIDGGLFFVPAP